MKKALLSDTTQDYVCQTLDRTIAVNIEKTLIINKIQTLEIKSNNDLFQL